MLDIYVCLTYIRTMPRTKVSNNYKPYVYKRAADLGIPVRDATDRVLVVVTRSDVVNAKKANSKHCALARAALRLPDVNAAYFFRSCAFIEYQNAMVKYQLPSSVQKEIVSFDRAGVFAAGIYQLSPISPMKTAAQRAKYDRKRNKARRQANKAKTSAHLPPLDQREFQKALSAIASNHLGKRTVSGIQRADAPIPLPNRAPSRYVHKTQYVRDLREPTR